jgi:hypothetical protein
VVTTPDKPDDTQRPLLPTEVEIYINPDGSVTFADLEASLVLLAHKLKHGPVMPTNEPSEGSEPAGN